MRKTVFLFLSIVCCSVAIAQKTNSGLKLWYNKPATIWEEALPLGNAKTGAMVFGGVAEERFQLNDNTLWSGYPNPGNVSEGPKILQQVREQLFTSNWDSAAKIWKKMHGPYSARYLPLADLWIRNNLADTNISVMPAVPPKFPSIWNGGCVSNKLFRVDFFNNPCNIL